MSDLETDRLRAENARLRAALEDTARPLGSMADHFVRVVSERNEARAELRLVKAQSDEEFARQALEGWTEDPRDPLNAIGRMYQGVCAERDSLRAALAEARSGAFIADYSSAVPNLLAEATQTERARCIENVRDSDACDSCRRSIEADIVGSGGAQDARGSK